MGCLHPAYEEPADGAQIERRPAGGRLEIASKADEGPTGTVVSAIFPAERVIRA